MSQALNPSTFPARAALPPGLGAMPDFGTPHQPQVNLVKVLHHLYRGRYLLAATLAAGGLLIGALLGYFLNQPRYRSEATINVQPIIPKVSENDSVIPMFQNFVNTQVAFLNQPRTITAAMNSPDWLELHRPVGFKAEKSFRDSLLINNDRMTPGIIIVGFVDEDATAAFKGCLSVCESYEQIFAKGQSEKLSEVRLGVLTDQRNKLDQEIKDLQDRVKTLTEELGASDPQFLGDFQTRRKVELQAQIAEIEMRLAGRTDLPNPHPDAPIDPAKPRTREDMTYEEISAIDPPMARLIQTLMAARAEREQNIGVGLMPGHHTIVKLTGMISRAQAEMEVRRQAWLRGEALPDAFEGNVAQGDGPGDTLPALKAKLEGLRRQLDRANQEAREVASKSQELEDKRYAISTKRDSLKNTTTLMEELQANMQLQGKIANITIIKPEKAPGMPNDDKRMKWAAVLGMLGAMVPVTIVGIYGLFDRRYRYSDEALEEGPHNTTMLGILPRLPTDLHDVEQSAAAAHCVHQIRTLMQIGGAGRKVFAVTSSNPGDGKTSMALSLGLSFAGSGSRTLMVDLDMIGQGLSRGLRMREQSGFFNVIMNGDIKARIKPTHIERLWLLPTGLEDDHRTANRLAEPMVRKVIETVRDDYDIIVIDTGPVLGSIEAHLVCAQADAVVLVVGAGRARGQVKAAVDQLHRVGAKLLGLVFNLAEPKDFKSSAASQSFRSVRPEDDRPVPPPSTDYPELEPLPRVVALDTKRA